MLRILSFFLKYLTINAYRDDILHVTSLRRRTVVRLYDMLCVNNWRQKIEHKN